MNTFNTPYNYHEQITDEVQYSFNDEASETIPDQSLTIEEILMKFAQGETVHLGSTFYYESNDESASFDDIDPTKDPAFDLADVSEIQASIEIRKRLRKEEADAGQRRLLEEVKQSKATPVESDSAKPEAELH